MSEEKEFIPWAAMVDYVNLKVKTKSKKNYRKK